MRAYSVLNRLLLLAGGLTGAISLQAQVQIVSTTPSVCGFGKFTWEMDNHPGPITLIFDGGFTLNYTGFDRGKIQGVGPGTHSLYAGVVQGGDTNNFFYNVPSGNYYTYVIDNSGCNSSKEATVVSIDYKAVLSKEGEPRC